MVRLPLFACVSTGGEVNRLVLVGAFLAIAAGCVSSRVREKTRILNEQQLEALKSIQEQQAKIRRFVEAIDAVDRADVFVRESEVMVFIYFKPGASMSIEQRDAVNDFIFRETGIPRESIRLLVKKFEPSRAATGLHRGRSK